MEKTPSAFTRKYWLTSCIYPNGEQIPMTLRQNTLPVTRPAKSLRVNPLAEQMSPTDAPYNYVPIVVIIFGILEMIVGLGAIILNDFIIIFESLAVVAGGFGIISIILCTIHPKEVKIYDLLASALLFAYGCGTLVTLTSEWTSGTDILTSAYVSESWLSLTLGLVVTMSGLLHVVGTFDQGGHIFPTMDIDQIDARHVLYISGLFLLVAILFIATGKLGFMANVASSEGSSQVSVSSILVLDLMTPIGALALLISRRRPIDKIAYIGYSLALLLLLIQFGLGRRIFVFSLISYIAVFFLANPPKRLFSFRTILAFICLALLAQVATTAFYTLRIATYSLKYKHTTTNILDIIPEAIDVYKNRDRHKLFENISSNVSSRSFVLNHLAQVAQQVTDRSPLYGENMARVAVMTAPSIIYPSKFRNPLFGPEEDLAHPHLRMPYTDAANTLLTGAIIDFGFFGLFALPIIVCIIYSLLLRLSRKIGPPILQVIIAVFLFKFTLSVEADIDAYAITIRSILGLLFGGLFLYHTWHLLKRSFSNKQFPTV